ncbi:MAG TPA: type II toxin-antitoxin system prevent-host-death family antitoxin [Dehalococcoidia bacterium]|nr:type II toxin-antitoxin system prevent-host-death family antitoxin [Dehalococcoidia bacterium]
MKTVGSYEAKTHLPRLLEEVASGESVTITKHGVPIAMLVPVRKRDRPEEVIKKLRAFRQGVRLRGLSIKDLIEEGRR